MVRPEDITGSLNNQWFSSLAGFGDWLVTIIISIVCLATLYLLWNYFDHRIRLCVFPIYGASEEAIEKAKNAENPIEFLQKLPNIQIGMPKKLSGKRVKVKGVSKFQILKNPFRWKRTNDINYEWQYPEGIWMLEPKKDIYIPIKQPKLDGVLNIKVPENDIEFWMQLENEEQLQRTRDETEMKRQLYLTIAIIIGAFVLCGIIIWLSMSFAGNTINDALSRMGDFTQVLQNMGQGNAPG